MSYWSEIRTAYHVARLGTLSAASEYLKIHRATVVRHIDSLEHQIGEKLFIRHQKGYKPTDIGNQLIKIGSETEAKIDSLVGLSKRRSADLSGQLVISALDIIVPLLLPVIKAMHSTHPNLCVSCEPNETLVNLDYGEAHIAIRAGKAKVRPDWVMQRFCKLRFSLYAHKSYIEKYGLPKSQSEFSQHKFVGNMNLKSPIPFDQWLQKNVDPKQFVFSSKCHQTASLAIQQGEGIGFHNVESAKEFKGLVEVIPSNTDWDIQFWMLTHGDLHRTRKVQTFLKFLRDTNNHSSILKKTFNMPKQVG